MAKKMKGYCSPAPGKGGGTGRKANKSMSWDGRKQGPSKINKGFGKP